MYQSTDYSTTLPRHHQGKTHIKLTPVLRNDFPTHYDKFLRGRRGTVEPCLLWGPRGLQAHGFESCPWSECRLGFLTQGNGFLAGGL
ncbi:hypothetical protein E2C01_071821 [Portunus trituberculatus]|uniref:Uncharacterized protein n=1 Tax=Portunus trituberculatus TaxID=210409 RepID=A0A5B7I651_PORTR|nr:hypothetical protein [Portunus trituberculatus]